MTNYKVLLTLSLTLAGAPAFAQEPSPTPTESPSPEPTATASPSPEPTASPSPSPTATKFVCCGVIYRKQHCRHPDEDYMGPGNDPGGNKGINWTPAFSPTTDYSGRNGTKTAQTIWGDDILIAPFAVQLRNDGESCDLTWKNDNAEGSDTLTYGTYRCDSPHWVPHKIFRSEVYLKDVYSPNAAGQCHDEWTSRTTW